MKSIVRLQHYVGPFRIPRQYILNRTFEILRGRGNSAAKVAIKLYSIWYNCSNPDFLIGSIALTQEKAPESLADQIRQRLLRIRGKYSTILGRAF